MRKTEVPVWEKATLTVNEAAAYSGIRTAVLRQLTNEELSKKTSFIG